LGNFQIDINGLKGPNTLGRDIFQFYIGANGILYPMGSKIVAEYFGRDYYWETATDNRFCCNNLKSCDGGGCTARIFEKGKMDY